MKRIYIFGAGVVLGVAATRRTRRAKDAARAGAEGEADPVGDRRGPRRRGRRTRQRGRSVRLRHPAGRRQPPRELPADGRQRHRVGRPGAARSTPDRSRSRPNPAPLEHRAPGAPPPTGRRAVPALRLTPGRGRAASSPESARSRSQLIRTTRGPMQTHEIRRRFLAHFERAGHTVVPSASLISQDADRAVHDRRDGAVQAVLPRPAHPAVPRAPPACRSASAPATSRTSASPPGTTPSSRWPATSRSATTSRPAPSSTPGRCSPARWTTAGSAWTRSGSGSPSTSPTTRPPRCGRRSPACPPSASSAAAWTTTSGRWACPDRAGPCSEIYYDRGPEYGDRGRPGRRRGPLPRGLEPRVHAGHPRRVQRSGKGDFPILGPLPQQNIDTGLGVERLAFLLQGVDNVYETDLLRPIIGRMEELSGPDATARTTQTTCGCG